MDLSILTYKHDDFEVTVRTDDIADSWSRFQGRITYRNSLADDSLMQSPQAYCQYKASEGCEMSLYNPMSNAEEDHDFGEMLWPVIYETNRYQISILFKDVDYVPPRVVHVKKEVEACFYSYWEGEDDGKDESCNCRLTGDVSFLNEPGLFRLGLQYQKNGQWKEAFFSFEVVSPKLDTKHDYKSILDAVNREFEETIFRYLSLTMQQLGTGHKQPIEVWMEVFEQIVKDYLKGIDRIIKSPHSKMRTQALFAHADRIKRWSPAMEEEYAEKDAEQRLEDHYFRYEVYDNTVNTMENRFVKYTLVQIGKKLTEAFGNVLNRDYTEISSLYRDKWEEYQRQIGKYQKHPFFAAVGKFEGLRQESLVLQSRMGYQQIYKDWLKLRKGIDFYTGATNIGTMQIWEIYELWCFIKVKNMVLKLLRLDPKSPLITEPNGSLIKYQKEVAKNRGIDYHILIKYPKVDDTINPSAADEAFVKQLKNHECDEVSIHYQHTFSRNGKDEFDICSMTTEQRPDIVVNIRKKDGTLLTYLYDAKYRVWSDKDLDHPEDWYLKEADASDEMKGADYPPADAINQMHRYRDAIYYGMRDDERPESKEIIGGYILFPGRGDDETIKSRFYSKSIEKVNIGAFPLLPCKKESDDNDYEGPQLYAHLRQILLEKAPAIEHVKNAVPQRGLRYQEDKHGVALIMMENYEDKVKKFQSGKIGIPVKLNESDLMLLDNKNEVQYVLFHVRNKEKSKHLFKVKGEPRIFTKGIASGNGYYLIQTTAEIYLCADIDVNEELDSSDLNPSFEVVPYDSQRRYDAQYASLEVLTAL